MNVSENLLDLIGNTPLVKINKMNNTNATILAKVESFNPGGSIKDRPALSMIEQAEKDGIIHKGATIIEPTSGNTGIGLAMVCAIKGYKAIFTMPETMSLERRMLLKAYGAELVLTEASKGMQGAVDKAMELRENIVNSFIPMQFNNPANPQSHIDTTAEEIWQSTDGQVDIVVAGVGTGGTITGLAKGLKNKNVLIETVAVEPMSSQVLAGEKAGPHKIQGIGANFVPQNFDKNVVDKIVPVSDENAIETARSLATEEGILCGISSGAAMCAALQIAKHPHNEGKLIVVILPDSGERYLSSPLYENLK
ncbi:MAG: cysteine synthase A [Candidatus Gastranaerophilaceae bacterium]